MAAAFDILDPKALEKFLAGKPVAWSRLIASRSALRVLPILLMPPATKIQAKRIPWTTGLRACFISWVAGKYPSFDAVSASISAAESAAEFAALAAARSAPRSPARSVSAALSAASSAARSIASSNASSAARLTVTSSAGAYERFTKRYIASGLSSRVVAKLTPPLPNLPSLDLYSYRIETPINPDSVEDLAADSARSAVWETMNADIAWMDGIQREVSAIIDQSLWHGPPPPPLKGAWNGFINNGIASEEGYAPWIDWYRLLLSHDGRSSRDYFGKELSIRIATQPDEWWERPAVAINADIAQWIMERHLTERQPDWGHDPFESPPVPPSPNSTALEQAIAALPAQGPASHTFRIEDGRLHAEPMTADGYDSAALIYLDEVREKAGGLLETLQRSNANPRYAKSITRLLQVLPTRVEDANPAMIESRGFTIQSIAKTVVTPSVASELSESVIADVLDVSLTVQRLCQCFPQLRKLDLDSLSMGLRPEDVSAVADNAAAIIAALKQVGALDETAADALDNALADAGDAQSTVDAQAVGEAPKTVARMLQNVRNALLALFRFSNRKADGIAQESGKLAGEMYQGARRDIVKTGSSTIRYVAKVGGAVVLGVALNFSGMAFEHLTYLNKAIAQFKEITAVAAILKSLK